MSYDDATGTFAFNPADSYTKAQADGKFETQAALGTTLSAYALKNDTVLSGNATLDGQPIVNNATLATYVSAQGYAPITDPNFQGTAQYAGSTIVNQTTLGITLNDYVLSADLETVATSGSYNDLTDLPTLFSGSYNDLTDTPTLGTAAATDATAYTDAATGTTNDNAIDNLIASLVAIGAAGGDATAINNALAALVRDNT